MSGNMDITEAVVNQLRKISKDFKRFFDTHFILKTEQSLVPNFSGDSRVSYPKKSKIVMVSMDIDSKLRYYLEDLTEYNDAKAKYLKIQIMQLLE